MDRTPDAVAQPGKGGTEDTTEVVIEVDLEDLPPGAEPLASKFHKFANAVTMLGLVKGVYSEDLLSSRLEGRAIKEALAITLLLQFREENPSPTTKPPHWIPRELPSLGSNLYETHFPREKIKSQH